MAAGINQDKQAFFRADIEGLRAIAVLAVLFFHLDESWLPGGFVGVDVFFVISGFIITHQLLALNDKGTFSVLTFWVRRIRRLYPAMLSVIALTLIVSFWVLPPTEYLETAESGLAAIAMGANIYFADRVGYFAPIGANRELLHLWSLSFEQQFYLLIPLLFYWRPSIRTITITLSLITLVSFILAIFLVNLNQDRAFFLPFGRFWEIAIGALIAVWLRNKSPKIPVPSLITALALLILGFSFFWVNAEKGYPDFQALLPTLATALLIVVGSNMNQVQTLLTNPFMRWHGRTSYTLYLVHWPVIILFDKAIPQTSQPIRLSAILIITYSLTLFIHKFIEMPMRHRPAEAGKSPIKFAALFFLTFAMSSALVLDKGALWRLPKSAQMTFEYKKHEAPPVNIPRCIKSEEIKTTAVKKLCEYRTGKEGKTFLLLGDSHMGMMAPQAVEVLLQTGYQSGFVMRPSAGCPILTGVSPLGKRKTRRCGEDMNEIVDIIHNKIKPDRLFLIGRWANFGSILKAPYGGDLPAKMVLTHDKSKPIQFAEALEQTVKTFSSIPLTIVASVPEQAFSVPSTMTRSVMLNTPIKPMRSETFHQRQSVVLDAFKKVEGRVTVLYPHKFLCSDNTCAYAENNLPLYYDDNHLTHTGALKLQSMFRGAKN